MIKLCLASALSLTLALPSLAQELPAYLKGIDAGRISTIDSVSTGTPPTLEPNQIYLHPDLMPLIRPADVAVADMTGALKVQVGEDYSIITDEKQQGAIIWELQAGDPVAFEWCRWLPVCTTLPE